MKRFLSRIAPPPLTILIVSVHCSLCFEYNKNHQLDNRSKSYIVKDTHVTVHLRRSMSEISYNRMKMTFFTIYMRNAVQINKYE